MNEVSTKIYEYVIVFKDGSNKFISKAAYDTIIEQSTSGMDGTELGDMYIDFKMIGKMLTVKDFYDQYPAEKEKSLPAHRETAPITNGVPDRIEQLWVKKLVSKKDWNIFYSRIPCYANVGNIGGDVMMGFCMGNPIFAGLPVHNPCPSDCYLLSDDEMKVMNNYCKANNIHPQPFEELKENNK